MIIARKYRYLLTLVREKHFGRAAHICHISPSTLSTAIREIELELGTQVVKRGRTFMGLTPEGELIVQHIQQMVQLNEHLQQSLGALHHSLTGHLNLGVIPTALTMVAKLSAQFRHSHPQVTLSILSLGTQTIVKRLQRFELEAGIIYSESVQDQHFYHLPLWTETHVFLCTQQHRFAQQTHLAWHEAAQVPLCLLTPDMQNRKMIDQVFTQLHCQVTASIETNSLISMLAHVATGLWCAIVPQSVLEQIGLPPQVVARPLVNPTLHWQTSLVLAGREPWSPILEAFINTAKQSSTLFNKTE